MKRSKLAAALALALAALVALPARAQLAAGVPIGADGLHLYDGSSLGLSTSGNGMLIYDATAHAWKESHDGSSYALFGGGGSNPQSYTFTDGASTNTVAIGAVADTQWLKVTPAEVGALAWSQALHAGPNTGSAAFDQNMGIGWNQCAAGPCDGSSPSGGWHFESHYQPAGDWIMENHVAVFIDPANPSVEVRAFDTAYDFATHKTSTVTQTNHFYVLPPGGGVGPLDVDVDNSVINVNGASVVGTVNNVPVFKQWNHALTQTFALLTLNASDQVELGTLGAALKVLSDGDFETRAGFSVRSGQDFYCTGGACTIYVSSTATNPTFVAVGNALTLGVSGGSLLFATPATYQGDPGAALGDGFVSSNPNAATSGTDKWSPALRLHDAYWTDHSVTEDWAVVGKGPGDHVSPSRFSLQHRVNAGGYSELFAVDSTGAAFANGSLLARDSLVLHKTGNETVTGADTWNLGALGAVLNQAISLTNSVASTNVLDQWSPSIEFTAHYWAGVDTAIVVDLFAKGISSVGYVGFFNPNALWAIDASGNSGEWIFAATNQITLGTTAHHVIISSTAPAGNSQTYTMPDIGGSGTFAFLQGAQFWFGAQTFSAATTFSNTVTLNGTNTSGAAESVTPGAATSGTQGVVAWTMPASTGQTAGTEINSFLFTAATRTWASNTGIATQREWYVRKPTYAFASATGTITDAFTAYIEGGPVVGTNAAITRSWALGIGSDLVGTPGNNTLKFMSGVTDGASAVAYSFDTINGFATVGDKVVQFKQGGTEIVALKNTSASTYIWQFNVTNGGFLGSGGDGVATQSGQVNVYTASTIRYNGTSVGWYPNADNTYTLGAGSNRWLTVYANKLFVQNSTVTSGYIAQITSAATASGTRTMFEVVNAADTNQTLSTEIISTLFDFSATRQWATGAITTQREMLIKHPTYGFVGSSTVTTAATVDIDGAPAAGTNAAITNSFALRVEGGAVGFGQGTVTQATSITTGVTVNTASGVVTTVSASTAAQATSTFTVTDSSVVAASVCNASLGAYSGTFGTNGTPLVSVSSVSAGSFNITIYNAHASTALAGTLKINFLCS